MKKSIILFLLAFISLSASAQDPVNIGGLWYTLGTNYEGKSIATVVSDPKKVGYSGDVVIPETVSYGGVNYEVIAIGREAFCGTDILSVNIKCKAAINYHAFAYCKSLASVIIGGATRIYDCAFYACDNLVNVVVGGNVNYIGYQAFQNCPSLTSVIFEKGQSSLGIGASSFFGCENLKDLYFYGEYCPYESGNRIFDDDQQLKGMTIHVPEAYAANYNSYPWSKFGKLETMTSTTLEKCAKPTITYENGTVSFACATEGVEFNSKVEYVQKSFNSSTTFPAPSTFLVKVVAVKNGYLPSDAAEQEFDLPSYVGVKNEGNYEQGDVNKDGKVNVADQVVLTNVMN